jgi:hypothetical protein
MSGQDTVLPGVVGGHRSHSAPPAEHLVVDGLPADGLGSADSPSNKVVDYNVRTSLEYYQYYHSQKPLDPRLPPPLHNWSAHIDTHGNGMAGAPKGVNHIALEEADEEDELHKNYAGIASSVLQNDEPHDARPSGGPWGEKSLFDRIQDDFPRTDSPLYDVSGQGQPGSALGGNNAPGSPPKTLGAMLSSQAQAMHAFNTAGMQQQKPRGMMGQQQQMMMASQQQQQQQFDMHGGMYGEDDGQGLDEYADGITLQMQQLRLQQQLLQQQQRQQQGYQQPNMMQQAMGGMGQIQGINNLGAMGGVNGMGAESMEQLWLQQQLQQQQQQQQQGYGGMNMQGVNLQGMSLGGGLQGQAGILHNIAAMQGMRGMQIGMNPAMLNQMQGMGMVQQMIDRGAAMGGMDRMDRMGMRGGPNGVGGDRVRDRVDRGRGDMRGGVGPEVKRSSLLEEFRASKLRNFELADIVEHCDEFCRDQHGSRFIQTKLEIAPPSETEIVFNALLPTALSLMTDLFGNYVVQKFLERGSQEQRSALAKTMQGRVLQLSLDMYGCRVVQKAVEVVDGEEQAVLVNELQGHVMKCVRDQNGNHVIQKCIERSAPATIQFIVDDFIGQVVPLATHPYGCRVIQRILEYCGHSQVINVLNEIVESTRDLVFDQYGNYVVQHVLEHGQQDDRSNILMRVRGNLVAMSQHKFASNVVEKLLQFSSPDSRHLLLEEFTGETQGQPSILIMMRDAYGNYVIQKALDVCQGADRERLIACIKEHMVAVRRFVYGKHIIAHIEKLESGYKPDGREGRNCRMPGPPGRDRGGYSPHRDRGVYNQGDRGRRDMGMPPPGMQGMHGQFFSPHVQ